VTAGHGGTLAVAAAVVADAGIVTDYLAANGFWRGDVHPGRCPVFFCASRIFCGF
jgi:hypothetical protein